MRRLGLFALLFAGLAGCSGTIAFESFPDALLDARCIYLERCGVVASRDHCLAYYTHAAIENPSTQAAYDAGKLTYSADLARDCIDAFGALSCDATEQDPDALDICNDVITGTLAAGATCAFDKECESDNCDVPTCTMACCTGTCGPPVVLPPVGQPCTALCDGDAYCGVDNICHAPLPAGAACTDEPCAYGLYCKGVTPTASGTCSPYPRLGEACENVCADVNATCLGRCVEVGVLGDACSSDADCAFFYHCTGGACALMPTRGMACSSVCSDESWCNNMICEAQKTNGATCLRNDECLSHYCSRTNTTGTCADVPLCF